MRSSEEIQHFVYNSNQVSYERRDNWFYWQIVPYAYPIVHEGFRGFSPDFHPNFAPITLYNAWPRKLSNASLFPYLLPSAEGQQCPEFQQFVQMWYQCSCAIIYDSPHSECKIIGSGCLTEQYDTSGNILVATARHNFQGVPRDRLFVRFFNYTVSRLNDGWLYVQEHYLDIPVVHIYLAKTGLDAGYLALPKLRDLMVFGRYAKALPIEQDTGMQPLAAGHYVLFHFAGGQHQISVGEIELSKNFKLVDDIGIQAGPGASGAAVVWHAFGKTKGSGISIYRMVQSDVVERRLIPFSEFANGFRWADAIKAPYWENPNFSLLPMQALNSDGYEYLRYRSEVYGHPSQRPEKPTHPQYRVGSHHSNHHIVPIEDLLYLWDYLHKLDIDTTQKIKEAVKNEIIEIRKNKIDRLNKELYKYPVQDRTYLRKQGLKNINQEIGTEEKRFQEKYKAIVEQQYYYFHLLLASLCSPEGKKADRTRLAWSWWNLFQGWESSYRQDDPSKNPVHLDYSEKVKPQGYNPQLWTCLKENPNGLYHQIQALKKTTSRDPQQEQSLYASLTALNTVWSRQPQVIYSYNVAEWEEMGRREGHSVYRVKPG